LIFAIPFVPPKAADQRTGSAATTMLRRKIGRQNNIARWNFQGAETAG
jgi:hypothetical protein